MSVRSIPYFLKTRPVGIAATCVTTLVSPPLPAKDDFLIVTEYVNERTSRALIFAADDSRDTVVIDQPLLTHLVPVNLRPQLRENDHVFVEASQAQGDTLTLRVWGYGKHHVHGFRWRCDYNLLTGAISCQQHPSSAGN